MLAQAGATVLYVGIAELKISNDPSINIVAPNLGSCLGVIAYDTREKIGGMVHCLLPSSTSDPAKAKSSPCTYVDTGVSHLLDSLFKRGADRKSINLVCVGGASLSDPNGVFEIGKKNFTVLRKLLWKNNLLLKAEDVGGENSRTLTLEVGTGSVFLKTNGETRKLI